MQPCTILACADAIAEADKLLEQGENLILNFDFLDGDGDTRVREGNDILNNISDALFPLVRALDDYTITRAVAEASEAAAAGSYQRTIWDEEIIRQKSNYLLRQKISTDKRFRLHCIDALLRHAAAMADDPADDYELPPL